MDLEDIYALLPDFQCLPGCTECCRSIGAPSRTELEEKRIRAYIKKQGIRPGRRRDNSCPYVSEGGCAIYPVRPFICRLYGTSPNYLCKMGVRPVRLLHEDEEAEIWNLYRSNFA